MSGTDHSLHKFQHTDNFKQLRFSALCKQTQTDYERSCFPGEVAGIRQVAWNRAMEIWRRGSQAGPEPVLRKGPGEPLELIQ